MRFVLQRVKHASVKVDGELIGSIGRRYMVLMAVATPTRRKSLHYLIVI